MFNFFTKIVQYFKPLKKDSLNIQYLKKSGLVDRLNSKQINLLLTFVEEKIFDSNQPIIEEGELSYDIFIIKAGRVAITKKDPESGLVHLITEQQEGAVFGEISILDDRARTANINAIDECKVLILPMEKLKNKPVLFNALLKNLARNVIKNLDATNLKLAKKLTAEVNAIKHRVAMGIVTLAVLVIVALYIVISTYMKSLTQYGIPSTVAGAPLMIVFAGISFLAIRKSEFPLSYFGFTLKQWKRDIKEALLYSIPVILLSILIKAIWIYFISPSNSNSLFLWSLKFYPTLSIGQSITVAILYVVLIPFQEIMIRGGLQSSLSEFLLNKYRKLWAILVTSLLFGAMHSHISLSLTIATFFLSLYWGWLYAKQNSLIGVIASHTVIAIWFFYILGIPSGML